MHSLLSRINMYIQSRYRAITSRKLLEFCIVTVCAIAFSYALAMCTMTVGNRETISKRDFVVYWSTGHLITQHRNPYDTVAIGQIEQSVGLIRREGSMYMRNPPWSLPLAWPLGFLPLWPASLLWSAILLASLGLSVRILHLFYGRPRSERYILGLTFMPALFCFSTGQTSMLALLGLTIFLRYYRTHPLEAGAALTLCFLKPHLFLLFGVVLAIWIVRERGYRLLLGFIAAQSVLCLLTQRLDPHAWQQYIDLLHATGRDWNRVYTFSFFLRRFVYPHQLWMQYVPAAIGILLACAWFWKHRDQWDWNREGHLLILWGLLVAPYSWLYDLCIALPALLYLGYRAPRLTAMSMILISAGIELELWIFSATTFYYSGLWSTPAIILWYFIVQRQSRVQALVAEPELVTV